MLSYMPTIASTDSKCRLKLENEQTILLIVYTRV